MDYYKQKQIIACVDADDTVQKRVEKWGAHKKGILHRGFTVILKYKDSYLLQHRKHPVFDGYFDLSYSSHPVYINNKLQDDLSAIYESLKREWNIEKKGLAGKPLSRGKFIYKASDKSGGYTEHEVDHIYLVEIKKLPEINLDFAYGYSLLKKHELQDIKNQTERKLAPWVKEIITRGFL